MTDQPKTNPETLDPGSLESFEPHVHETWLFGFGGITGVFDPYPPLLETFGEVDPGRFDVSAYEAAVAHACFESSLWRIEAVFRDSAPAITLQGVGGKRRDALHVQVALDRAFVRHLRRYVFADGGFERCGMHLEAFSGWLDRRYGSRPGFHPWHSTAPAEWVEATDGFTNFRGCRQGHKLGALLEFVVTHYEAHYGEPWTVLDRYEEVQRQGIDPRRFYDAGGEALRGAGGHSA